MGMVSDVVRKYIVRRPLTCSSCGGERAADNRFVAGPGVYICERCSRSASASIRATAPTLTLRTCSFCGKSQNALPLGTDPRGAICIECVALVEQILSDDRPLRGSS